jgi:O-antigen ligase
MQMVGRKSAVPYVLMSSLVLFGVPVLLGLWVASSQHHILKFAAIGLFLTTLFFSNTRYLIVCTAVSLFCASSQMVTLSQEFLTLRWAFLATLAMRAVVDWLLGKALMKLREMDVWVLSFLALAFYSQQYSILPTLTFQRSVSIALFYVAAFWGVWNHVRNAEDIHELLNDFLKVALMIFFLSLTVFVRFNEKGRFMGFFDNPNAIGFYILLMTPLALWSFFAQRTLSSFFLLLMMMVTMVLCRSRSAMLSTGIGLAYFLWFYHFKRNRTIFAWLIFVPIIVILYNEFCGLSSIIKFLRLDWKTLALGGGRMEAWTAVVNLIAMRPWLGYGFGTEDHLFETFDILFDGHAGAQVHNSYLGLVSQLGLMGFALFFVPLFFFFLRLNHRVSRMPIGDNDQYVLHLALNAVILSGLVHALFESWLYSAGTTFAFSFWTIVILAQRLDQIGSLNQGRAQGATAILPGPI